MKKVFVKPEMMSHKLRGGKLLVGASGDNPKPTCGGIYEIQQCKDEGFGCPDGDGQQQWWH